MCFFSVRVPKLSTRTRGLNQQMEVLSCHGNGEDIINS